jgi:hypothetical protein
MPDVELVEIRPETAAEHALDEWFARQTLASLDNVESAARTILGLVTALIGALFGVLTVASKDLPAYLYNPLTRVLGVVSVVALLLTVVGALGVLLPLHSQVSSHRPDEQKRAFQAILGRKSRWLTATVVTFGIGVDALGLVLVIALLTAA